MNKLILILTTFYCLNLTAQNRIYTKINEAKSSVLVSSFNPFSLSKSINLIQKTAFKPNVELTQLDINQQVFDEIYKQNPQFLSISLPLNSNFKIELELIPQNIFGDKFRIIDEFNTEIKGVQLPRNYIGIIKGETNSLVSLSISENEMTALISSEKGNFELNRLKNSTNYAIFNSNDLLNPPTLNCTIKDDNSEKIIVQNTTSNTSNVTCENIGIYIEVDSTSHAANSNSVTQTTNWVNNIFSKVATLYANEGINIVISELKIWTNTNPNSYRAATNSGNLLYAFNNLIGENFQGRLAHLLSTRPLGGGVAWVNTLCVKQYAHGVSTGLSLTTANLPTYSWNVMCVAHEMGHNFGSPHTHSCSWEGGAIDNCALPEGQCTSGPTPTNGGTIMSYCHLNWGIGINFSNGFGQKPGALIRQRVQECLGTSISPTNLSVVDSYSNSVILNWNSNFGINGVSLEYKLPSASNWTVINQIIPNYVKVNGLTANSTYQWRLKRDCSNYSTNSTFITNNTPMPNWCQNTFVNNCFGNGINLTQLDINNQNLSQNTSCNNSSNNLFFNPIITFNVGQNYSFSIKFDNNQVNIYTGIWIDFNKNGTFESTEKVFGNTNPTTNGLLSGNFSIPNGLNSVSKTRMRIICSYPNAPNDPCGNYNYGETEDYIVNIQNNCVENLVLQSNNDNLNTGNVVKEAKNLTGTINATNKITGNANVIYRAGRSITFSPGFVAEKGTVFKTEFGGCN